jgi:CRISPR system Cascade subunit CasE
MHLTRGFLNPASRNVLRDLSSPVEMHRSLLRAFPDDLGSHPRAQVGLLYRVDLGRDGGAMLVAQSRTRPDFTRLPEGYFLGETDERFFSLGWSRNPNEDILDVGDLRAGQKLLFRLRANVTRKIDTKTRADGARSNGRRVPVRGDEARLAWLTRKAALSGFAIEDARCHDERAAKSRREDKTVTLAGVRFDGLLQVTDETAFGRAVAEGIGPAKAYGFGLLSVAKVR